MSSTSDYMRYTAPRQRSLTTLRTILPDISEHTFSPPTSRTPTPPFRRPSNHLRSVSVASFHSDGTIEIDGFGFDNMSEIGDDASIFGGESVYADSVFDGPDDAPNPRPHTPGDLSWRAERILANAKKKLDLCGQNISRARSSLILSPSTTPTSFHEQLNGVRAMPAFHSQRFRMRNEAAVGSGNGGNGGSAHVRASSESAVIKSRRSGMIGGEGCLVGLGLGTIADEDERSHVTEQAMGNNTIGPSKSTQQMRALRDQMKDLRGKINSLQEQAKTDSMRRRSISSLRSTPTPYDSPTLMDDLKYQPDSPQETWESAEESPDEYASTVSSGTPRAYRRSVISPFSAARHEDREDAFSYDALFYGNGIYANGTNGRPISYGSDGTESTTTAILEPTPHFKRRDSFDSINSFATAAEDRSSSSTESLRRKAASQNPHHHHPTPSPEWLATPTLRDDGYHSAPHTPKNPGYKDYSPLAAEHKQPAAGKPYPVHPSPTQQQQQQQWSAPPTSIDAVVTAATRGKINRKSVITLGAAESMLLTSDGEIRLQLSNSDRELIESMIEGLGEVCCSMEMEQEPGRRAEYRRRLEGALKVLRGEAAVVGSSPRPEQQAAPITAALKRERSVGANWGGRYRGSSGYRAAEEWMGETDDECF